MSTAIDPVVVTSRVERLRERLADCGGGHVRIVAVTKTFPAAAIEAAMQAGIDDIGENYAQECVAKLAVIDSPPTVHFIGRLQRNKVRHLAGVVDVWQTVDRPELGREIAKRAPGARVMVQVDISGEPNKGGCAPADVSAMIDGLRSDGLEVTGLMGVAVLGSPAAARPGFALLRGLVDTHDLAECSMGMSADLEVAVAEGATMVRIGRDLFGERAY